MIPGHWTDQYGLGGIVTRKSMERAINELRARNAELVAALKDIKRYANDHDDEWVPERVDRALAAAGRSQGSGE